MNNTTKDVNEEFYNKKTILILIGLILFNFILFNLLIKSGGYDASGNYIPYSQKKNLSSSLVSLLVGFPIVSIIIGLLIAIFPNKNRSFSIKFKRSSFISLILINGLFSLGLIFVFIMTLLGWYPATNASNKKEIPNNKEKVVLEFKKEIIQLCDSANYYLDYALKATSKGENTGKIKTEVFPKLKEYEYSIDKSLNNFQTKAQEIGLSEKEYEKVIDDLDKYFSPMLSKYKLVKEKVY